MTKLNILEKLKLVEAVEDENAPKEKPVKQEVKKEVVEPIKTKIDSPSDIEEKLDVLIESYEKNKFLTIEEIYRNKSLDHDVKQSIFIAEVFMKALPENLPVDIKKKSTLNIIEASGLRKEDLLNDAYIRIDALNTILEETVAKTAEIKSKNEASIKELEERIEILKRATSERHAFEEKQTSVIEYEIQRVINIVDGIK